MKTELKIIVLAAIGICLFSMVKLNSEVFHPGNRQLYSGVATWRFPLLDARQPLKEPEILANPFGTRFFETASLKGFIRNEKQEWCAIFYAPGHEPSILEPGRSLNGLTLVSANGQYCRVRFGSIIREFSL